MRINNTIKTIFLGAALAVTAACSKKTEVDLFATTKPVEQQEKVEPNPFSDNMLSTSLESDASGTKANKFTLFRSSKKEVIYMKNDTGSYVVTLVNSNVIDATSQFNPSSKLPSEAIFRIKADAMALKIEKKSIIDRNKTLSTTNWTSNPTATTMMVMAVDNSKTLTAQNAPEKTNALINDLTRGRYTLVAN